MVLIYWPADTLTCAKLVTGAHMPLQILYFTSLFWYLRQTLYTKKCQSSTKLGEPSSCPNAIVGGRPLVISDPLGAVAQQFMALGAAVVQEVAKLKLKPRNSVRWVCTSFAVCLKAVAQRSFSKSCVALGLGATHSKCLPPNNSWLYDAFPPGLWFVVSGL